MLDSRGAGESRQWRKRDHGHVLGHPPELLAMPVVWLAEGVADAPDRWGEHEDSGANLYDLNPHYRASIESIAKQQNVMTVIRIVSAVCGTLSLWPEAVWRRMWQSEWGGL